LKLVNRQLEQRGLILKTRTVVDATLLQAARRAPGKEDKTGGDGDASFTVKKGQPHYGYKAHVAVDHTHTLIRTVTLSGAHVHDSREFETVVRGDEEMVVADNAYWSSARSQWCAAGRNTATLDVANQPALERDALREATALNSVRFRPLPPIVPRNRCVSRCLAAAGF